MAFVPKPLTSIISQLPVYPKPNLNDKTQLGFLWIVRFYSKFNFRSNRLAQVVYQISHTPRGVSKCDDWNLGNEYFTKIGISIDDLYSEENQAKMLEGVKIPLSKAQDGNEDIEDASCESENQCFVKWSAIPAQQFHFLAAKPVSCSNLLAVPIWKSTTEDVLKNLDNFIAAVSEVLNYPPKAVITVHSGVYGDLELPTTITLAESDVPVPDMVYKFIIFNQTVCKDDNIKYGKLNNSEDEIKEDNERDTPNEKDAPKVDSDKSNCISKESAIIVVVHNNPYFNPDTDKICRDMCEIWGWDEIQIREVAGKRFKSKYIYCCEASDSKVREKLGLNNDIIIKEDSPFALNFVFEPNYDEMDFQDVNDIRDTVVKEYKEAFEGGEPDSLKNIDIEFETEGHIEKLLKTLHIKQDKDEPETSEIKLTDDEEEIHSNDEPKK